MVDNLTYPREIQMIHGYHVIFGAYGFWLPNDPRGSWSDFVGEWELTRFGNTTKSIERIELTPEQVSQRQQAKRLLKYPVVQFNGKQGRAIGQGFHNRCLKSNYTLWACSVLPEHVHLVIARHTYKAEQMVTLLKGEASRRLAEVGLHPMAKNAKGDGSVPSPWAKGKWIVYLDNEDAIDNAIMYVEENPVKENKPKQNWKFVTPFAGLDTCWITYH